MDLIRDFFEWFINFVLHMDKQLPLIVKSIGIWSYLALFLVIFVETGVVIMPFLPGDLLLFAAGAVAAHPDLGLNPILLYVILAVRRNFRGYRQLLDWPFYRPQGIHH